TLDAAAVPVQRFVVRDPAIARAGGSALDEDAAPVPGGPVPDEAKALETRGAAGQDAVDPGAVPPRGVASDPGVPQNRRAGSGEVQAPSVRVRVIPRDPQVIEGGRGPMKADARPIGGRATREGEAGETGCGSLSRPETEHGHVRNRRRVDDGLCDPGRVSRHDESTPDQDRLAEEIERLAVGSGCDQDGISGGGGLDAGLDRGVFEAGHLADGGPGGAGHAENEDEGGRECRESGRRAVRPKRRPPWRHELTEHGRAPFHPPPRGAPGAVTAETAYRNGAMGSAGAAIGQHCPHEQDESLHKSIADAVNSGHEQVGAPGHSRTARRMAKSPGER
ncbi:MAG: hypothetical protein LUO93_02490, partial [Methanomicrobiales archaeon]|nr:hypothetical protein [Methanomicrobiales archaeon]